MGPTGDTGPTGATGPVAGVRIVSGTSASAVTVDFASDGIVLLIDPVTAGGAHIANISFANYTAGKRCTVIVSSTDTNAVLVTLGVDREKSVAGDTTILVGSQTSEFLEYVCVGSSSQDDVYLSSNKP
jgi:hypothetical protein